MKKITLVSLMLIFIAQFTYSQTPIAKRIKINNPTKFQLLKVKEVGIDLSCGAIYDNNSLILELGESDLKALNQKGISYTVVVDDLIQHYKKKNEIELPIAKAELEVKKAEAFASKSLSTKSEDIDNFIQYEGCSEVNWAVPTNFNLGSMGGCLTYSEVLAELDQMRALYPNLISVKTDASPGTVTHGNSFTNGPGSTVYDSWAGQPIYYVRISDNPDTDEANEPESLYSGMTHSREVSSMMNLIYYMWYVLENYGSDAGIKNLVDNHEMYFIPVANPDGLMWNEQIAPSGGGMQRKNLGPYNTGDNPQRGVDLNRNYDYFWGPNPIYGGSSGTTTSDVYRGPSAFSEPETQIVRNFSATRQFKTALNHHATSNLIPHAYNGYPAAPASGREADYHKFCHDLTRFNRYIYGEAPDILTVANGDMSDWMLGGVADVNGSKGSRDFPAYASEGVLALAPENGSWVNSDGEGGFWPNATKIVEIAQRAVRMNFVNAYHSGKFAQFHDLNNSNITSSSGSFEFGIEYLGQTLGDITLDITPVSGIQSITPPATQTGWSKLEQRTVTAAYTLNPAIQPNDEIEFQITLSNDDGYVMYRANIIKIYNPTLLFSDNPDTDNLSNWTSSGASWGTTVDAYSGTRAITESPGGSYNNNQSNTLTLNSNIDLSASSAAVVQFFAKWDLERNFDYVQIEGSTNGSTWFPLCGKYTKPGSSLSTNRYSSGNSTNTGTGKSTSDQNNQPTGESIYDGDTMDKWVMEEILIDATENSFLLGASNARFRFVFDSDNTNRADGYPTTFDGFIFDDFKVIGRTVPCAISVPTGLTTSNITASTATADWDNIPSATYDLRYKETSSGTWIDVLDLSTTTYNITGLTASSNYEVQVRSKCGPSNSAYTSSTNFSTIAINYCDSNGANTNDEYIGNVTLENINNTSAAGSTSIGYSNYTGSPTATQTTDLAINGSYTISVTKTWTGTPYNEAVTAWIDYNKNGVFEASEKLINTPASQVTPVTNTFTIPASATLGATRMRVSMDYDSGTIFTVEDPCATHDYGEVEDYTVNIISNTTTWYQDLDSDTFGNPSVSQVSPTQPVGYVADNTDCDDNDADEFPGQTWYIGVDNDNDTFFGSTTSVVACESPGAAYATTAQTVNDCDDNDADEFPGQTWYIGVDNDNDTFFGSTTSVVACESPGAAYATTAQTVNDCDDNDADEFPGQTWYIGVDNDNDTFFGSTTSVVACESPGAAYATTAQTVNDCDDNDADEFPGQTWYIGVDNDNDTFFGSTTSVVACESPGAAYATSPQTTGDCDDNDADEFPGQTWYIGVDNDNDTFFGSTTSVVACESPGAAYATSPQTTDDCDDNDADEFPGQTWYIGVDNDNDTFFGSTTSVVACESPGAAYATTAQTVNDCDDNDADEFPGQTWYIGVDNDNDTFFGSTTSVVACESPGAAYATTAQTVNDCDDNDADEFPGQTWYIGVDNDNDTFFGSTTSVVACESPGAAYATTAQTVNDCDDNDADEFPGQTWYIGVDNDNDTFFGSTTSVVACESPGAAYATSPQTTGDCDDNDADEFPGQTWYIGVDNDNDTFFGSTTSVVACESPGAAYATTAQTVNDCDDNDADEFPGQTWYIGVDNDNDTFFGSTTSVVACESPGAAYATTAQTVNDCDDNDADEFPGQTWYIGVDNDNDTFFGSTTSVVACESPGAAYATTAQTVNDCDDNDADEFPGQTWYIGVDNDNDTFFGSTTSVVACESPGAAYATSPQTTDDCDDNDADEFPGQTWYVGVDNDNDTFFGSTTSVVACESPGAAYATSPQTTDDCDDNDADEFPGQTWYVGVDNDNDTFFGSTTSIVACESPGAAYATSPQTTDDCDDNDADEFPGQTWYVGVDNDNDTFFGSTTSIVACESPGAAYATSPQTTDDCDDNDADEFPGQTWYIGVDNDNDTFFGSTTSVVACESPGAAYATSPQTTDDCDDNDADEFPGQTWYVGVDNDNDTFFGSTTSIVACESPGAAYATSPQTTDDCDDNDADEFPGQTWYVGVDNDNDTFFGSTTSVVACESPGAAYATSPQTTDDCDDNDADEFPGQTWYVGVDNDNDTFFGSTTSIVACESPGAAYATSPQTTDDCDDNDADEFPGQTWYVGVDNDNDTFFGSTTSIVACESPGAAYATSPQTTDDCDDNDADEFPGQTWYIGVDNDNDTFFGSTTSVVACESPGAAYATSPQTTDDCDDNDADEFPGQTWYIGVDNDNDTFFGSTTSIVACESPGAAYATSPQTTDDCDDNDADEFPGQTWYVGVDNDNDTFFGSTTSVVACESPGAAYATSPQTTDDCDDNDADEFPGQTWYIGVDNDNDTFFGSTTSIVACESPGAAYATSPQTTDDCDDNDADEFPGQTWYIGVDNDNDTFFGSTTSIVACESPGAAYATSPQTTDDCDDNDADEFPGQTWYIGVDNDNDTFFGSTTSIVACESPGAAYATSPQTTDDCDDNDADEFPGQTWYVGVDNDNDTFFGSTTSIVACESPGAAYATSPQTTDDCDDNDADINPNTVWYLDADNDNFADSSVISCTNPGVGYTTTVLPTTDCDDSDNTIYPGATEIPNDGIDQDCDGSDETTLDTDNIDFEKMIVTPNPFNNNVNIKVPLNFNNSEFSIKVFDLNGRLVIDRKYYSVNSQINVNDLDKLDQALYLFKIENIETGVTTYKRLIKD